LNAYRLAVGDGDLPTARGVAFSDDDRLRGDIIERLMCDLRADIGAICREHGAKAEDFTAEMEKLAPLAADGIVTVEAGRIAIPEEGRAFVRLVAAVFDAYLDDGQRRHSKAV
jgi:oxygen-independent coproporphyrinogen-3 oxidase